MVEQWEIDSAIVLIVGVMLILVLILYMFLNKANMRVSELEKEKDELYNSRLNDIKEAQTYNKKINDEYLSAMNAINIQLENVKSGMSNLITLISSININNKKG